MNSDELSIHRSGEAAQRLLSNVDFRTFLEDVREQADFVAYKVLVSGCDSFEEYKHQSGFFAALQFVLDLPEENTQALQELMEPNND